MNEGYTRTMPMNTHREIFHEMPDKHRRKKHAISPKAMAGPVGAGAGTRGCPHDGPRSTACSTIGGMPLHKEVEVPQDNKSH